MTTQTTTLPISVEELRDLVDSIESDWGFEYCNEHGAAALKRLRQLVGGTPNENMGSVFALLADEKVE